MADMDYNEAIVGEGEYWDSFVAERVMRGEIPGSIDWRLTFSQFRYNHDWRPFCLGAPGINFRMNEIQYILKTAVPRPGVRVLDLGCGAGWLSLEMARLGADVLALDISPANLALATYMAEMNTRNSPYLYNRFAWIDYDPARFGSVRYEFADLNNAQLPVGEFDAVVVWDSLHHIANLEGLLEQVRRSLKPDGVFVGVDHASATMETWNFNNSVMTLVDGLYSQLNQGDPQELFRHVAETARTADWGAMSIDYDDTPIEGWKPFEEQVLAEMLEVMRGGMTTRALHKAQSKAEAPPADETAEVEESPFEDVSNERLMNTLLTSFESRRFTTLCPYVEPEKRFPRYRTEDERLFQHHLAATLVTVGDMAIAQSYTDGQWFLFNMTPNRPQSDQAHKSLGRVGEQEEKGGLWQARLKQHFEDEKAVRYTRHLESEIERKNLAIARLEARVRRYEAKARWRPRLPWKR